MFCVANRHRMCCAHTKKKVTCCVVTVGCFVWMCACVVWGRGGYVCSETSLIDVDVVVGVCAYGFLGGEVGR